MKPANPIAGARRMLPSLFLLCASCAAPGPRAHHALQAEYERAIENLNRRISAEPANPNLLSLRAQARYKLEQFQPCADDCTAALALGATGGLRESVLFNKGRCLAGQARHREAVTLYSEAAEAAAEPTIKAECLVFRAMSRWALGEDEPALADAELALGTDPESGGAGCLRILIMNELHRTDDLQPAMERLIASGKVTGTLASMGLYASKDFEKSEAAAASAIEATPIDGWAWFRRARARTALGRMDDALGDYQQAALLLPGRWSEQAVYAAVLNMRHRDREALEVINAALHINPDSAEALTTRALIMIALKDYSGAESDLRRAIAGTADCQPAYAVLGELFKLQHDDPRAVEAWSRALAIGPATKSVLFGRAGAYLRMSRYEWTVTDCAEIVRLGDRDAAVYTLAASAYLAMGDRGHASWCFQEALRIDPAHHEAREGVNQLKDEHPIAPSWSSPASARRRIPH